MRKFRMIGALWGALILTTGVTALANPAQAATGDDCKPAVLQLPSRPDSGTKGNNWAVVSIERAMNTCEVGPVEGHAGLSLYTATVIDAGDFKTLYGASPGGTTTLKRGTSGTVVGGFKATFTAPSNWDGYKPRQLKPTTPTPEWVATAWTAKIEFDSAGPVADWAWSYKTDCEEWINAEDEPGNSRGDITGKTCPTPDPTVEPTASPTATATPGPAPTETDEPGAGGGGTMPVTGAAVGALAGGAALLMIVGGVLFFVTRRRKVSFTA